MIVMKTAQRFLEIETLLENLLKKKTEGGLLKYKVLSFASQYENLSVSMIIEKLGIKKSNFALLASELEKQGLVEIRQAEVDRRCRYLQLTQSGRAELENYLCSLEEEFGQTTIEEDEAIDQVDKYLNKRV